MIRFVTSLVTRQPKRVLTCAAVFILVSLVPAVLATDRLKNGGFDDPHSESTLAAKSLADHFGGAQNFVLIVTTKSGNVDDGIVSTRGRAIEARLATNKNVTNVSSYWSSDDASMRGKSGSNALIVGHIEGSDNQVAKRVKVLTAEYVKSDAVISVKAGGLAVANNDIDEHVTTDLAIAEAIAVPLTLILLLVVFGSVVAAALPLMVGLLTIFGTLAALFVLSTFTDVSIYALNLTTAMGLGLSIDYALLIVSRFREELARGASTPKAVQVALNTAGRTVLFSSATVGVALAALAVFPMFFLRSFAYAGIAVVVIAMVSALAVLPAVLMLVGPRINSIRITQRPIPASMSPFWRDLARGVIRHPLVAAVPVLIALLLIALPMLNISFGSADDRSLPPDAASRVAGDILRSDFSTNESSQLFAVVTGSPSMSSLNTLAMSISRYPGVRRVNSAAGVFISGVRTVSPSQASAMMTSGDASYMRVLSQFDPASSEAESLVHQLRAIPESKGVKVRIGGDSAVILDSKDAVRNHLPVAVLLIALSTFVLLFLFTGSVVLPAKALLLNAITLASVMGLMTWIFHDGHLAGLLGFTPSPIEMSMPILLFCVAFGLSMDYEVFVLSRIKEARDRGADNEQAIAGGLGRTGRIVSAAAALLAVSFLALATSSVSSVQLFGLGTGIAILIDATLVRGILVPAFMSLMDERNWYRPEFLDAIYARLALTESPGSTHKG